jgi:glycosyltransferase involved in cell wall biosynthesis
LRDDTRQAGRRASADVTVVIPSYKALHTIKRAVSSILSQQGVSVRVVVVIDDGCLETEALVRGLGDRNVDVLVNETNQGAQVSRNRGLAIAESPYIMFLDSDDYVEGPLLRGLVDVCSAVNADLGFGPWRKVGMGTHWPSRRLRPDTPDKLVHRWLVEAEWVPPCAILWRTQFVLHIGGWDEALKRNQDGEIALRAIIEGAKLAFSDKGEGLYYQHESEHRITKSQLNYDSLVRVAEKLLSLQGGDAPSRRATIAQYLYLIASGAFRRGNTALGMRALERSRELGFRGHLGSKLARLGSTLMGPERYHRCAQKLKPRTN